MIKTQEATSKDEKKQQHGQKNRKKKRSKATFVHLFSQCIAVLFVSQSILSSIYGKKKKKKIYFLESYFT